MRPSKPADFPSVSDDWMEQRDVRLQLETSPVDEQGCIEAFLRRESHIEFRCSRVNPLPLRECLTALERGARFREDQERVKYPVIRSRNRLTWRPQIAPRLWKYVKHRQNDVGFDEAFKPILAWSNTVSQGTSEIRFSIQSKILKSDFQRKGLKALWCIESHRYSEKTLAELGLSETEKEFRGDGFVYRLILEDRPTAKLRMNSASFLMGKRIVNC
jgi:hypothetical protein